MITALKGTGVAPPALRLAPRFVLAALLGALLRRVGPEPGAVSLVDLIPTLHYDAVIVAAGEGRLGAFADIEATVLLLGGSRSPKYIKSALAALEETLPNASRVELRGCGHSAPDNDAQPTHVAEELIRFFS
jgi:pimeloyl-ACP methyl ester carboxylesterase